MNDKTELQTTAGPEQTAVVTAGNGTKDAAIGILAIIQRAAQDDHCDVDKMERLMSMYERQQSRTSEESFNAAMADAQAKMGPISADCENKQTRSRYASYSQLDRALRPIYTQLGFALSFSTDDSPLPDMMRVVCYVSHRSGHTRMYRLDMPCDGKGAKGNDVMTKTHAVGSGSSYAMRYLLKMVFNVAIGEADDDGNAASGQQQAQAPQTIMPTQVQRLNNVLAGCSNGVRHKFGQDWPDVSKIPVDSYDAILNSLAAAAAKHKARQQQQQAEQQQPMDDAPAYEDDLPL